jgi:hypothetical protein
MAESELQKIGSRWINPIYLNPLTQSEIREKFEDSSEISLPDFLIEEKYQEMCGALAW